MKKITPPLIAILVIFFSVFSLFNENGRLISPLIRADKDSSPLEKIVSRSLSGTKGTYAIIIKKMKGSENYSQNQDRVFEAASLYKLWVMGAIYEKISKGEIKEDEILSQDVAVLNEKFEIEEDEAELSVGEISMTVNEALNQMITISHNFAALLLLERVKNSQVEDFMKRNGFNNSHLGTPPETTAADIALFFEKLYKGEIVSPEYSQKMMDILKRQKLVNGLPKYLPQGAVASKTGDLGWFKHDGGIVFTDKGDYIIVVLSETNSPAGAQDRIATLSKALYEYFTK